MLRRIATAASLYEVTGANRGLGYAIVKGLCTQFDGDVVLTSRDEGRGKAAVDQLQKEGANPKFHVLDIECLESIRKLKEFLQKEYGGLDVLVNNAAIKYKKPTTVPFGEQAENTVRVNYFGTRDVCHELFPLLRPYARVVNISSSAGRLSNIYNVDVQSKFLCPVTEEELSSLMKQFVEDAKAGVHKKKGWANSAYEMSKIGLTGLTFVYRNAFAKDTREDIVINAVHPGYVCTDMNDHKGKLTPDQGAETPIYLALLQPNVETPRGEYVWFNRQIASWL